MHCTARSSDGNSHWSGTGDGTVVVELAGPENTLFLESGHWKTGTAEMAFTNHYRWTRAGNSRTIELEHLRYGSDNPVYLVELFPNSDNSWICRKPHLCGKDRYSVEIHCQGPTISMRWIVRGPDKDQHIHTVYS